MFEMAAIMRPILVVSFFLFSSIHCQINVYQKSEDGYIKINATENEGPKQIYTSMHELKQFFDEEIEYVNDLRQICDRKLVSTEAINHLGSYLASYDDVLGSQEEDESFLYNPLNVYNLIRHVAVGWNLVENIFQDEKQRLKPDQKFPKRVRKVIARSKKKHIPGADDLDGVSVGIVRLHDYYKFNVTSFVQEGVLETDEWRSESNGELTVWDAFKIGVKGANQMFLGSGIDIMLSALEKAKVEGVSVPPFVEALDFKVLKNLIKTAKTVHDQKLDRWGPRTPTHSTNSVPYDRRLAKKKKFQNVAKEKPVKLHDLKIVERPQETAQYIRLCRGEDLRPLSVQKTLQCKYSHQNKPYYIYGPRKVEVVSHQPYVAVIHNFITDSETKEMIATASPRLRRSQMVGKTMNATHDDRRVSAQSWVNEKDCNAAQRLTTRLDYFLDVSATSARDSELYQVANYGIAGQYEAHYDAVLLPGPQAEIQKRELFNIHAGDRYATVSCTFLDQPSNSIEQKCIYVILGHGILVRRGGRRLHCLSFGGRIR